MNHKQSWANSRIRDKMSVPFCSSVHLAQSFRLYMDSQILNVLVAAGIFTFNVGLLSFTLGIRSDPLRSGSIFKVK